jgi:hypothetical protein
LFVCGLVPLAELLETPLNSSPGVKVVVIGETECFDYQISYQCLLERGIHGSPSVVNILEVRGDFASRLHKVV